MKATKARSPVVTLAIVSCLALSSCWQAEVEVSTSFELNGSGRREIVIDIIDDTLSAEPIPNPEDVERKKGKGPVVNNWHIEGGLSAIHVWLVENSPSWLKVHDERVEGVHRYFMLSFEYTDFKDFLMKYESLVNLSPTVKWEDFSVEERPRWEAARSGLMKKVRFYETQETLIASLDWIAEGIFNDIYRPQTLAGLITKDSIWDLAKYKLRIGDESFEELSRYDEKRPDGNKFGKIVYVESDSFFLETSTIDIIMLLSLFGLAIVLALATIILLKSIRGRKTDRIC